MSELLQFILDIVLFIIALIIFLIRKEYGIIISNINEHRNSLSIMLGLLFFLQAFLMIDKNKNKN